MPNHGKPGFRVLPSPPRLAAALLERFRRIASANLADAMGRFNHMDAGIRSRTGFPLCGLAVTAVCRPGDNLMVHKAMQVAERGDVIVVATGGNEGNAVFGGLMGATAAAAGLGGLVVDGAIRDVAEIRAAGFPAFSRAVTPSACDRDGPGEVNVSVSCGGAVVSPGDIVVGDEDGVVVVPRSDADEVLAEIAGIDARERERLSEIKAGKLFRPDVNDLLRKKGVID